MTALSAAFRYGVKQGAIERNVVRDLDSDDRRGAARLSEPRYLTLDEVRRLLAAMGDTFRPVAATCAYAGLGNTAKLNGDDRQLVGLHDLRHSFVALALASGLTLPEASALARHANPRITA